MEGGGKQQRYARVTCVNTVETKERHTRQTGELPYHILTRVDVDAILPTYIPNVHQPSVFLTKFLSRFVCVPLRTTWLCITTTQNWVWYGQLIQLKLSKCILADWFLTWAWDLSCTRSGNYEACFHSYFWNLITEMLTLSMPCMTNMSHLQIHHQRMSSAVVWLTMCSCHCSDGHVFSHACSEVMSWWMNCNSIWPSGLILICACHLLCHISKLGMYLIQ